MPTTERMYGGDVSMKVIQQTQQKPGVGEMTTATPWQQYRAEDLQPSTVAFSYVIVLCSRLGQEVWICDITSSTPNELIVVRKCLGLLNYRLLWRVTSGAPNDILKHIKAWLFLLKGPPAEILAIFFSVKILTLT